MSDAFASVREFLSDEDLVKCNEIATNFVFPPYDSFEAAFTPPRIKKFKSAAE